MRKSVSMSWLLAAAMLTLPVTALADAGEAPQQAQGERDYPLRDFTAVTVKTSDSVDIRVGNDFSVRAQGATTQLDDILIDRRGETLRITRRGDRQARASSTRDRGVRIVVTLPRLTQVNLAGSGDVTVDRVEGPRFQAGMTGSGQLAIGAMRVDEAKIDIAGSGTIRPVGSADTAILRMAGSGSIAGRGLRAGRAQVEIAGSGGVTAQVQGPAQVKLMGSGSADLGPESICTIQKMGSGHVRCGRSERTD
ncbi:head GIN domain-containing protein [Sphingomonas pseudosanguinis]|uniref:Putative auto-transporter adhesin head GIN domain-containing protein n=2 Tax=Sphingomonas pseudosanguinis TaxID=413712 RepID=A0A7W6A920_9SPHN|nr:head GIN domain-containing protein [Sphingomonas pseudosanguinis]MBB3879437.1 hypothetical protein [Sphingomonas pseudosanguinis]